MDERLIMLSAQEKEIVEQAYNTIKNKDHWCQNVIAEDINGQGICASFPKAVKFCAIGAICRFVEVSLLRGKLVDLLDETSYKLFQRSMVATNDSPNTDEAHLKVIQIYEKILE